MKSDILEYGVRDEHLRRRKWISRAGIAIGIFSVFVAASFFKVSTSLEMDSVTGSTRQMKTWNFGIHTGGTVHPSALALRLEKMNAAPPHNWCVYSGIDWSFLETTRACGRQSMVGRSPFVNPEFLDRCSDAEVLSFVRVMQSGTPQQQEAVVAAARQRYGN